MGKQSMIGKICARCMFRPQEEEISDDNDDKLACLKWDSTERD